eukprot:scaffold33005_cov177-Skeletonema_menzelii.AAC.4
MRLFRVASNTRYGTRLRSAVWPLHFFEGISWAPLTLMGACHVRAKKQHHGRLPAMAIARARALPVKHAPSIG